MFWKSSIFEIWGLFFSFFKYKIIKVPCNWEELSTSIITNLGCHLKKYCSFINKVCHVRPFPYKFLLDHSDSVLYGSNVHKSSLIFIKSIKLTVANSLFGSTFSFSNRCPGSDSLTILQFFSLSVASVSRFDDFGGTISGKSKSGGRLLFGLNTAIEGIEYLGALLEFDMFSTEPWEELDLVSPATKCY